MIQSYGLVSRETSAIPIQALLASRYSPHNFAHTGEKVPTAEHLRRSELFNSAKERWKWIFHGLIQLKGVVLFGTNGAHTLYSYFTLLDNDMALYMVLFVWGAFSVVLTLYYYYNSMPQIAGTSDYYIRLVEMGNGCKGDDNASHGNAPLEIMIPLIHSHVMHYREHT